MDPKNPAPVNRVELTGRVSAAPQTRVLPSGDEVVSFRLVVARDRATLRRSRQSVDTIDCSAWTAVLRRKVARLEPGAQVRVEGRLHRRFSRGAAGPVSRVSVDLTSCAPLR
jgi:single-strand DNA-binding protein